MKKIPTLFVRDPEDRSRLTRDVNPACAWVVDGEGVATRKYDGTCVLIHHSAADALRAFTRREVKAGQSFPPNFMVEDYDPDTGKTFGWEPAEQSSFAKYVNEALGAWRDHDLPTGTYELIGPKINANPERYAYHALVPHGISTLPPPPEFTFEAIRDWLLAYDAYEGVVWHHPDGRMAKLKRRDFRGS